MEESMARARLFLIAFGMMMSAMLPLMAQSNAADTDGVVPRLVNYSGKAIDAQGKPIIGIVGVTFAIYKDETDGAPLWMETQNVQADARGNFSVQLGATKPDGLGLDLFSSGGARWLGVRINGGEEQARVLLLSVPYALKAADAQTLGGLPASAFMLAAPAGSGANNSCTISSPAAQVSSTSLPSSNVGGSGTQNYLPLWTDNNGDLGNSILYQLGTGSTAKIGINLKNPLFTLDVNGQGLMRGLFEMATTGYATASKGFNSNPLNIESSAFNSGTGKYTLNHFQWQAEPTGNNTTTTGATLNLLYGTDPNPLTETGLKLNSNGTFTFAPGQIFPGEGTVSSVGLSAPTSDFTVSGSPVTKTGTLNLNWTTAPTDAATANAIVKRDANGNFSAGTINAGTLNSSGYIFATGSVSANQGVNGYSLGVGVGVYGESDGSATGDNGVEGVTYAGPGSGVVGLNLSGASGSLGIYGQGDTGVYGHGTSYGFATDSNVQMARTAAGWVKAIAIIQGFTAPYTITQCFNSYLAGAAATTPPCGFNLTEAQQSIFNIDFGFQVSDRFLSTTLVGSGQTVCELSTQIISPRTAQILCYAGGNNFAPYVATVFVF